MNPLFIIASLFLSLTAYSSAFAASVLPITLEQLSSRAELIFYASVSSNRVKIDEISGQPVTITEFKIMEPIKGNTGETHQIKQLGGRLQGHTGGIQALRVPGVPRFVTGQQYVVFLPAVSRLGFSSPLGLHQGSFSVITVDGEKVVSSGQQLDQPQVISQDARSASRQVQLPLAVDVNDGSRARLEDFINSVRALNAQ